MYTYSSLLLTKGFYQNRLQQKYDFLKFNIFTTNVPTNY